MSPTRVSRRGVVVAAAAVGLATTGCAGGEEAPRPRPSGSTSAAGDEPRTVFMGDSITAGFVAAGMPPDPALSWATFALADPDSPWREVGNLAVPAETWAEIRLRYDGVAGLSATQLVLMGGTNDVLRDVSRVETEEALDGLLGQATGDGLEVWLVAPPPILPGLGRDVRPLRRLEERLAGRHGVTWVDATAAVEEPDGDWRPGMSTDGVHPTRRGARALGEAVAAAVRP